MMKLRVNLLALAISMLIGIQYQESVDAGLIVADDPVHGVDSIAIDPLSGLTWLRMHNTLGRSYGDVLSQLGVGGEFEGWRFARVSDLEDLFRLNDIAFYVSRPADPNLLPLIYALGRTGLQHGIHPVTNGIYDDQGGSGQGYGTDPNKVGGFGLTVTADGQYSANGRLGDRWEIDYAHPPQGALLVRKTLTVPEPTSVASFAFGTFVLVTSRRKRSGRKWRSP